MYITLVKLVLGPEIQYYLGNIVLSIGIQYYLG